MIVQINAPIFAQAETNETEKTTIPIEAENETYINSEDTLIINGKEIKNEAELLELLDSGFYIQTRSLAAGAAAGAYFIPGVGQVLVLATGAVVIGGVTVYAGHWAYRTVKAWFSNTDNWTADHYISKKRKAGIRRKFPSEYLPKTLKQINAEAKKGNARARRAKKLLNDNRWKK